ncbi:MAG: CRISPR-associated helicase Cas3' [Methanomassiliicoccales archaeon]|nr:MAG: CRISPR-associated helicase Cas3' [Methanomassiliicoccales archaeon]
MRNEYLLWAKAEKNNPNNYHPLLYHLIDSSSVAFEMWERCICRSTRTKISKFLNLNENEARAWVAFLTGCHDIGKATPAFQKKIETLKRELEDNGLIFFNGNRHHSLLSQHIVQSHFSGIIENNLLDIFSAAIGAHHGIYLSIGDLQYIDYNDLGDNSWREIRSSFLQNLSDLYLGDCISKPHILEQDFTNPFLIIISGIISVADWIASSEEFFPYKQEILSPKDYAEKSKIQAKNALTALNWPEIQEFHVPNTFRELFPKIETPFPLQVEVENISNMLSRPGMVIIEAPMGEGKTEAALYLMENWNYRTGNSGLYLALPTMATANQMFQRLQDYFLSIPITIKRNIALVHGHAVISNRHLTLSVTNILDEIEDSLSISEWFTYRKRGLLSPFGAGTIDQTFLGVMPTKHFFVRLFGMAGKTVIFDEVHAYDVYMSQILERELEWLSALGSNVIILSATLPKERLSNLIAAYGGETHDFLYEKYPRLTIVLESHTQMHHFPSASELGIRNTLNISLQWLPDDIEKIVEKALQQISSGGFIAVLCNTVKYAQSVYQAFKLVIEKDIEIYLLHSRFPYEDRANREKICLSLYGKNERDANRKCILVTTQIVEQSLDLDFDVIITQLAPIDLLLQRFGRLHRHERKNRPKILREPRAFIIKPLVNYKGKIDFGDTSKIYSNYVLMRTMAVLNSLSKIIIPNDIDNLVEAVYGKIAPKMPLEWCEDFEVAEKEYLKVREEYKALAEKNIIFPPDYRDLISFPLEYLEEDNQNIHQSLQALTRISSPSINLICLFKIGTNVYVDRFGEILADINDTSDNNVARLLLRAVSINNPYVICHFNKNVETPDSWKKNVILKNHKPLIFSENEMKGRFTYRCEGAFIILDEDLGILIE